MMTRASSAAFCCASFFERPNALPYSFSPIEIATSKVLAWSGPCSDSTVYEGASCSLACAISCSRDLKSLLAAEGTSAMMGANRRSVTSKAAVNPPSR